MRLIKSIACVIGVTIYVTPIFSSPASVAWGQQSSDQARLLLQMQEIREEISELRDLIERQTYELNRLKRAQRPTTEDVSPVGHVQDSDLNQIYSAPTIPPAQTSVSQTPEPELAPEELTLESTTADVAFHSSIESSIESSIGSNETSVGDLNSADVNPDSVVIEERVISAAAAAPAQDGFSPVEERVVGVATQEQPQRLPQTETSVINPPTPTVQASAQKPEQQSEFGGLVSIPNSVEQVQTVKTFPQNTNLPVPTVISVPNVATPTLNILAEQDYYQQGFDLLKQSKHDEAIKIFSLQIENYPSGDWADDAHYWIAESKYVNRNLETSKQFFKIIIDNFKQSPRLPDAMLKTAYIEQEQGNMIEARILLEEIVLYHPRSNAAISAKNRLVDLK